MPEAVLRTRVFDHSGTRVEDTFWERTVEMAFLPGADDSVQLWGDRVSPLVPVARRWWRQDGRVCIELVSIVLQGTSGSAAMKDGRLQWVPMGATGAGAG
jgi:hypothetical protein